MSIRKMWLIYGACCITGAVFGTEKLEISADNDFEKIHSVWIANTGLNKKFPGSKVEKSPNGVAGNCMKVTAGEGTTQVYMLKWISVKKGDQLKFSFQVKGEGTYQTGCYLYKADKKYAGIYMNKDFRTISPEKGWTKQEHTIDTSRFRVPADFAFITIEVGKNSQLFFDNFEGFVERKP